MSTAYEEEEYTGEDAVEINAVEIGEDDFVPPPPPPPEPKDEDEKRTGGNKKKWLIGGGVLAAALAVSLGLGLGLKKSGSNNDASGASDGKETSATDLDNVLDTDLETDLDTDLIGMNSTGATAASTDELINNSTVEVIDTTEAAAAEDSTTTVPPTTVNEIIELPNVTTPSPTPSPVATVVTDLLYDVVIIGAGWAGLRAADTLVENGVTNIIVLEANDYIGGRAKSINQDGTVNALNTGASNIPMDAGCAWLYNDNSRMETYFTNEGWVDTSLPLNTATPLAVGELYRQSRDGEGDLVAEPVEGSLDYINDVWGQFLSYRENNDVEGKSYQETIDDFLAESDLPQESKQLINLVEGILEIEYTSDSKNIDASEVEFFPEGQTSSLYYLSTPGLGYGNQAAKFAEPFADKIKLNAKVVQVDSSAGGNTSPYIEYVDQGVPTRVQAKTVMVTASLGALKNGIIEFLPELPDYKQEVIDNMSFGILNKVMMHWDDEESMVWPEDKYWFLVITPDDESSGKWTSFFNPSALQGIPSLTAWAAGDDARDEELRSDEEIMETVMTNLRSMFPDVREPDSFVITRWGDVDTIAGGYTSPMPGRDMADDIENLSRSLGRLYWAGEATAVAAWGSAGGSWNTGGIQARAIVERLEDIE